MKHITSRDNPTLKSLRALTGDAREPRRQGKTLVDGIHLVAGCLERNVAILQLLVSESGQNQPEIQALLARAGDIDSLLLRDALFSEISGVTHPVGIAAVIAIPLAPDEVLAGDAVVLDAVQDAGNVGAILRTAAAAGVRNVALGNGCAGAWTPRVLRAAQGAHFSLRIREQTDLVSLLSDASSRGLPSIATVAHGGGSLYSMPLKAPVLWLFGNEGAGLSPELVDQATHQVSIPLADTCESLNVAAAAAICLFEAVRQRGA